MAEHEAADSSMWISPVTHNEAENLPLVRAQVLDAVPQAQVIIIGEQLGLLFRLFVGRFHRSSRVVRT